MHVRTLEPIDSMPFNNMGIAHEVCYPHPDAYISCNDLSMLCMKVHYLEDPQMPKSNAEKFI